MEANALINDLRTKPVEDVVAWMVANMGHKELKKCVRSIMNEPGKSKSKSKSKKTIKETTIKENTICGRPAKFTKIDLHYCLAHAKKQVTLIFHYQAQ